MGRKTGFEYLLFKPFPELLIQQFLHFTPLETNQNNKKAMDGRKKGDTFLFA